MSNIPVAAFTTRFPLLRAPGVWLATLIVGLMALNAWRAIADPVAFSIYLGLPATTPDIGFVHVYALRAAFLGVFAAVLLARRDFRTLSLFALVAVLMPLGDAWLVYAAHGFGPIVARHLAIAVYLVVTWAALRRLADRAKAA